MNRSRVTAFFAVVGLSGGVLLAGSGAFAPTSAHAAPPKPAASSAPAAAQDAPQVPSVSLAIARLHCQKPGNCPFGTGAGAVFEGFGWGLTHVQVGEKYNKPGGIFDAEYNPQLSKVQPGRAMLELEAQRDDRKRALEQNFIQFTGPTGFDSTPIRAEYSVKNKESIQTLDRDGLHRYFFYFGAPPGERLWKIYEEVKLVEGGPLGKSFTDAVTAVNVILGVPARTRAADGKAVAFNTADWQDEKSILRLVDRGREKVVGVVLEDRSIVNALPQLRANKTEDPFALDPSVQAITAGGVSDPNAHRAPAASASAPASKPKKK